MNDSNQEIPTKLCSNCKQTKPVTDFYKRAAGRQGYQAWCKICNTTTRTEQIKANRQLAIQLLGSRCVRCGYDRYYGALHFHHPNPALKDDMFHRLRNRKWSYIQQTLLDQRVQLLCANCHAEEHSGCSTRAYGSSSLN